jgi:hypothetical protein
MLAVIVSFTMAVLCSICFILVYKMDYKWLWIKIITLAFNALAVIVNVFDILHYYFHLF